MHDTIKTIIRNTLFEKGIMKGSGLEDSSGKQGFYMAVISQITNEICRYIEDCIIKKDYKE